MILLESKYVALIIFFRYQIRVEGLSFSCKTQVISASGGGTERLTGQNGGACLVILN